MHHKFNQYYNCGPIVIGTGIAGLLTAISLAPLPVILISSGQSSCSNMAQGGIAAAVGNKDTAAQHAIDTINASSGLNDPEIVKFVTDLGPKRIELLQRLGVHFDQDDNSTNLSLGREAAHGINRILHCRGDATGETVTQKLWQHVNAASNIRIISPAIAETLHVDDGAITGVDIRAQEKTFTLKSRQIILATGGIGQLYNCTTNPSGVCGTGLGMALRAGAKAIDMEFVQFHPTAIAATDTSHNPLATEALRGEGSILVNSAGERFMKQHDPLAELAPRDIVARAVYHEIQSGGKVYLDARKSVGASFPKRFPSVYKLCRTHGIDPTTQSIPLTPAAHYHMGGLFVDSSGRTTISGLWACGEVASTGLHGANRLASNSLLENIVFAPVIAKDIKKNATNCRFKKLPNNLIEDINSLANVPISPPEWLRNLMYNNVSLIRHADGLSNAIATLKNWHPNNDSEKNIQATALGITTAALLREESRGGHFREDFPKTDNTKNKRVPMLFSEINKIANQHTLPLIKPRNVMNV